MADRVPVTIALGGKVTDGLYSELARIIDLEGLSAEWDGPIFEPAHRTVGEALMLYAYEVAWGRLDALENFCIEHRLPFVRWSGSYPGQWSPERIVFRGDGETVAFMVDESDRVLIDRHDVAARGSIEAILAYFDAAEFIVPPLIVEGDPEPDVAGIAGEDGHG